MSQTTVETFTDRQLTAQQKKAGDQGIAFGFTSVASEARLKLIDAVAVRATNQGVGEFATRHITIATANKGKEIGVVVTDTKRRDLSIFWRLVSESERLLQYNLNTASQLQIRAAARLAVASKVNGNLDKRLAAERAIIVDTYDSLLFD